MSSQKSIWLEYSRLRRLYAASDNLPSGIDIPRALSDSVAASLACACDEAGLRKLGPDGYLVVAFLQRTAGRSWSGRRG